VVLHRHNRKIGLCGWKGCSDGVLQ